MFRTSTWLLAWLVVGATGKLEANEDPRQEAHMAFLAWETGEWDAEITLPDPAGGGHARFQAVQTDHLGACGNWLLTDLRMVPGPDGAAPPPYEGHGVLGYDAQKGKLVGVWVDSKTSWLGVAEGSVDEHGRVLTLLVDGRHPLTGAPLVQEFVTTKIDAGTRRLEVFLLAPDGSRTNVARIDYQRRPEGAKAARH